MLAGKLHDVYEESDDMDSKDIEGKVRQEENEEDRESKVREIHRHGFEIKCGKNSKNSKKPQPMKLKNSWLWSIRSLE